MSTICWCRDFAAANGWHAAVDAWSAYLDLQGDLRLLMQGLLEVMNGLYTPLRAQPGSQKVCTASCSIHPTPHYLGVVNTCQLIESLMQLPLSAAVGVQQPSIPPAYAPDAVRRLQGSRNTVKRSNLMHSAIAIADS